MTRTVQFVTRTRGGARFAIALTGRTFPTYRPTALFGFLRHAATGPSSSRSDSLSLSLSLSLSFRNPFPGQASKPATRVEQGRGDSGDTSHVGRSNAGPSFAKSFPRSWTMRDTAPRDLSAPPPVTRVTSGPTLASCQRPIGRLPGPAWHSWQPESVANDVMSLMDIQRLLRTVARDLMATNFSRRTVARVG